MRFERLYSSSMSNLYIVTAANGKRLLIECGVTWPKLQKALNYDLTGIEACLLSHSHKDHSKAVIDVMGSGIDVYSSAGTFASLQLEKHRRIKPVADKTLVRLDSFDVLCFATNHDAAEPLGYCVRDKDASEYLLFATDTSHITQRFATAFNIIAIECSYDISILQERVEAKTINEELAKRLLSSHMEKQRAIEYLEKFCDLSKCREIHLLHMSGDNIDKEQTKIDFEKRFFIETHIGKDTNVKSDVPSIR